MDNIEDGSEYHTSGVVPENQGVVDDVAEGLTEQSIRQIHRRRVPTLKGKEYQHYLLERDYTTAVRAWRRQLNKVESALADSSDVDILQQERAKLESRMDDLTNTHLSLNVIDSNEVSSYDEWCRIHQQIFSALNTRISKLVDDRGSDISKRSRRSKSSGKSAETSVSSLRRRTEMLAKVARLGTEVRFHEVEREKTAGLRRHEDELKKLQIMKELAATKAEIEAVAKVEENRSVVLNIENMSKLPVDGNCQERVKKFAQSQHILKSHVGATIVDTKIERTAISQDLQGDRTKLNDPFKSCSASRHSLPARMSTMNHMVTERTSFRQAPNSVVSHQETLRDSLPFSPVENGPSPHLSTQEADPLIRLADLLTHRHDHDSLPRPQPDVFSGDLLQYPIWIKAFKAFIERKTKQPSERLYYVGKFTAGEAKEAVSGLLPLDTKEAYAKAKKILKNRFGNSFLVSKAYRKRIENWPKISVNDGQGLRKFSDFLHHCSTAMNKIHFLNVLNDPEESRKMLNNLPSNLVNRWGRIVDRRIGEEFSDKSDDEDETTRLRNTHGISYPSFAEFTLFLKKEARIACNPVTSQYFLKKEDMKKGAEKEKWNYKQSRFKNVGASSFASQTGDNLHHHGGSWQRKSE